VVARCTYVLCHFRQDQKIKNKYLSGLENSGERKPFVLWLSASVALPTHTRVGIVWDLLVSQNAIFLRCAFNFSKVNLMCNVRQPISKKPCGWTSKLCEPSTRNLSCVHRIVCIRVVCAVVPLDHFSSAILFSSYRSVVRA
jgi:hypothetical protein